MAFEFPFGSGDKDGVDGHHEYLEVVKLAMWGYVELKKELSPPYHLQDVGACPLILLSFSFVIFIVYSLYVTIKWDSDGTQ